MNYKNTENKNHMKFSPVKDALAVTDFIGCLLQRMSHKEQSGGVESDRLTFLLLHKETKTTCTFSSF